MTSRPPARVQRLVYALSACFVLYLALVALWPQLLERLPWWLAWFGNPRLPDSLLTTGIVAATVAAACVLAFRSQASVRSAGTPISVTAGLTAATVVLAFSSYVKCADPTHRPIITAVHWTIAVIKGSIEDRSVSLGGGRGQQLCPVQMPVALDVARITALGALLVGVLSIAAALLRARLDRIRLHFDTSVTAVVGADEDADAMIGAVARALEKNSRLVVVTSAPDAQRRSQLREAGHRVIAVDFTRSGSLEALPIWKNLDRLYLLSSDATVNVNRLETINRCMSEHRERRLPLIVRIDDPWQAEAWQARQFGGSDLRWAAYAVGRYEATAHRLLDQVAERPHTAEVVVCGTTSLTLALCAALLRRRLEREFYSEPTDPPLPTMTIVGENAEEYLRDQQFHEQQRGLRPTHDWLTAIPEPVSISCLSALLSRHSVDEAASSAAVIFTDTTFDPILGTRLAARFPALPIFTWSPSAGAAHERTTILGQLHSYDLTMELPAGHSHDVWERAAMLIHNRYAAQVGDGSPATRPWDELDDFYRGSNRRQVRNALWMVEQIGEQTWDTFGSFPEQSAPPSGEVGPLEELRRLGFGRDAAMAMAEAEHKDWCHYYRRGGWRYGPVRDDSRRIHDKLVPWTQIEKDPEALNRALTSLAATIRSLRELGYRSRPVWQRYRRLGTVIAEQRMAPWTWTSPSGETMRGAAGDWEVRGSDGRHWSVRDDIFRSTHEHVDDGLWRRTGFAEARPAREGEGIAGLEGPLTAKSGDWIVRGPRGEQWVVPADTFAHQYQGPFPP